MAKGWGGAIETIGGMIDGIFGLSPEQRKRKIKDKIDSLEKERKKLLNEKADTNRAVRITTIDNQLIELRKALDNL